MKQTLQLRLGQQLTMTPQLQQAIRLLQLSSLELQNEIQEILETNPMLEIKDDNSPSESPEGDTNDPSTVRDSDKLNSSADGNGADRDEYAENNRESIERATDNDAGEIPSELAVDSDWGDTFDTYTPGSRQTDADSRPYEQQGSTDESLQEHLTWQMEMTPFSETDRAIATAIIDAIDADGYLSISVAEIFQSLSDDFDIDEDEVESVLQRIQNFDPAGVGARDLRESLHLQLRFCEDDTPWLPQAKTIVDEHFELLASREYGVLMRRMKLLEPELQQVIALLQSLNPRPGGQITNSQPEYITPDVFVRKLKGKWSVELNPDVTPRLSINSLYASMAQGTQSSSDSAYMKNHLQEARWFLKSLKSRNETLLKVARCIVDRQRDFLEYGEEAMKPLVMHDVAEVVGMHESTISRVTTKKYMHTPRGIFELKYFFSSHVSTASGGECSATAIRAMLKKLIAGEQANKPLSDNKLASLLGKQGINVARRTVAKYREAMCIPPSNERKRLV